MAGTYRRHVSKPLFTIILALLLALMPAAGFAAAAEETYGSWTEYKEARGLTDFTWNQVTDAIGEVLAEASTAYSAGDSEKALSLICARPDDNSTSARLVHPRKTSFPIVVTVSGMRIAARLVQSMNADAPTAVISPVNSTLVRLLNALKA